MGKETPRYEGLTEAQKAAMWANDQSSTSKDFNDMLTSFGNLGVRAATPIIDLLTMPSTAEADGGNGPTGRDGLTDRQRAASAETARRDHVLRLKANKMGWGEGAAKQQAGQNDELDFAMQAAAAPSGDELDFARQAASGDEQQSLGRRAYEGAKNAGAAALEGIAKVGRFAHSGNKQLADLARENMPGKLADMIPGVAVARYIPDAYEAVSGAMMPQDKLGAAMLPLASEKVAGVAGKALGAAAKPVWNGVKGAGAAALERSTDLFSKIPPEAWEMLRKYPELVAQYARQGMTTVAETGKPIANAMLKAQELGAAAQDKLSKAAQGASKNYGAMMDYLKGDKSGETFDVAGKVYDKMEPYIETQTPYRSPVKAEATEKGAKIFNHFYDRIKSTLQEGMSPGEAADLLQQMSAEQADHLRKPISAHLEQLKSVLLDSLPGEYRIPTIDTPTPEGWSIKDTRNEYRAAKTLQRDTSKFANSETPVTSFTRMAQQGGRTGRAMKSAMGRVPGLAQDVQGMQTARAGADFAPGISPNIPRTGLTGGAMLLATKMFSNPAAMIEAPFVALGMSPRLAMETKLAASKGVAALEAFMSANSAQIPRAVAAAYNTAKSGQWQNTDEGQP